MIGRFLVELLQERLAQGIERLQDGVARKVALLPDPSGWLSIAGCIGCHELGVLKIAHICQPLVEHFAFASPAQETWRTVGGHLAPEPKRDGAGDQGPDQGCDGRGPRCRARP